MNKAAILFALAAATAAASASRVPGPLLAGYNSSSQTVWNGTRNVTTITLGSDVASWDDFGSSLNVVQNEFLSPGALVTGIGWDVTLAPIGFSWYSDMVVSFENSAQSTGVFLTVDAGGFGGGPPLGFSSGGLIDLVGLGLQFNTDADGLLRIEFFESFDDDFGNIDGFWLAGSTFTVQWVPAPGAVAVLGLGGLVAGRRRR